MHLRKQNVLALVVSLLAVGLLTGALPAQPPGKGQPPATSSQDAPGLTVVPGSGVEASGPSAGRITLGIIDPVATPHIERTFVVRNDTKAPLALLRVQPSCGCSTATTDGTVPGILKPGQQMHIHVVIDTTHLQPGRITKYVWVLGNHGGFPLATLEMTGSLAASTAFSPAVIDFGRVPAGTSRSLRITVSLTPRLLASGARPVLVSSNPDVRVTQEMPATAAAQTSKQPISLIYRVSLSPRAHLGLLSGRLSFVNRAASAPTPSAVPVPASTGAETPIDGVFAPVAGEVVGEVSVVPSMLMFGTVPGGKAATRSVLLYGASAAALQDLKLTPAQPWLSARLLPVRPNTPVSPLRSQAPGQPERPSLQLEVTLRSDAPAGTVNSSLTVVTRSGQQLVLPILGYVAALTP